MNKYLKEVSDLIEGGKINLAQTYLNSIKHKLYREGSEDYKEYLYLQEQLDEGSSD